MISRWPILWLCVLGIAGTSTAEPDWRQALAQFSPSNDILAQRAALLALLAQVGKFSRLHVMDQSYVVGSPGLHSWATPNTSYCTWWGINCCGAT